MIIELISSQNVKYCDAELTPNKQIKYAFVVDDERSYKQLLHVDLEKLIVVTKQCQNYSLVKNSSNGYILQLNYLDIVDDCATEHEQFVSEKNDSSFDPEVDFI